MKTRNKAFTLAETLVVMGIIGVIAALTIPNLSQSTGNREKVTKVKKAYAQLSEAVDRAQAIYGPIDEWFTSDADDLTKQATIYGDRVTEFLKLSQNCKTTTNQKCYGYQPANADSNYYKFVLADGTRIGFNNYNNQRYINLNISPTVKNTRDYSKEEFTFYIVNQEVRPYCSEAAMKSKFETHHGDNISKFDCAAKWIIEYDNMDYLKADNNYKCPNGTVLNLSATPPVTSCN